MISEIYFEAEISEATEISLAVEISDRDRPEVSAGKIFCTWQRQAKAIPETEKKKSKLRLVELHCHH